MYMWLLLLLISPPFFSPEAARRGRRKGVYLAFFPLPFFSGWLWIEVVVGPLLSGKEAGGGVEKVRRGEE